MSVVAGCALPDGAMLAADCRITIQRSGRRSIFVDNVQKIFPLATGTVIGFVGGVWEASELLQGIYHQIGKRRCDPVSLSQWIPRFFRFKYRELCRQGKPQPVAFMVASALFCRPNVIERARVAEVLKKGKEKPNSIGQKFFPAWFVQVLSTPPECQYVRMVDMPLTRIYAMRSPDFRPECLKPLQIAAIGSGQMAKTYIEDVHRAILASDGWMQAFWLRQAIRDCVYNEKIESVGGLYPVIKVKGTRFEFLTESAEVPVGGTKIELDYENHVWVQKNLTTGKCVPLVPPWQVKQNYVKSEKFDDLECAHGRTWNGVGGASR